MLIISYCIVSTNCLRVVCFFKIKFRMQAGSSGPTAPDRQRSTANYCLSCRSSVYFTYACDDQLSCSLHTPKMGAVVETWRQPLILGMHRLSSFIIACFPFKTYSARVISIHFGLLYWVQRKGSSCRVLSTTTSSQSIVTLDWTCCFVLFFAEGKGSTRGIILGA